VVFGSGGGKGKGDRFARSTRKLFDTWPVADDLLDQLAAGTIFPADEERTNSMLFVRCELCRLIPHSKIARQQNPFALTNLGQPLGVRGVRRIVLDQVCNVFTECRHPSREMGTQVVVDEEFHAASNRCSNSTALLTAPSGRLIQIAVRRISPSSPLYRSKTVAV